MTFAALDLEARGLVALEEYKSAMGKDFVWRNLSRPLESIFVAGYAKGVLDGTRKTGERFQALGREC